MEPKDITRFMNKVKKTDNCWLWTAAKSNGYGDFGFNGKLVKAHRFSYELFKGDIPEGLTIDHLCRNRACVNPEHLEPVTNKINILRGISFSAINAKKTHCPQGHAYTGVKDYLGRRICRTCIKVVSKKVYQRRKHNQVEIK